MAGQRTFTLIPQHPGRSGDSPSDPPARPMTSKQVQKAYKAANRAPRQSRAELARQEKAEQERIRKEFEKEKAANKARAAREKKKGKELAEREEKRKRGLPTVSVRPSQDTISWFVRGNGTAKKRDCEGRGLGAGETSEPVTPCPARGSKLVNIAEEEEEEEDPAEEDPAEEAGDQAEEEEGHQAAEEEENPAEDEEAQKEAKVEVEVVAEAPEQDLVDLDDDFEDDLALEMLQDVEASVKKASARNPEPNHQQDSPARRTTAPPIPSHQIPTTRYEQDLGLQRPKPQRPASPPAEPTRHSPSPSPSPSPPRQAPPMSTQAILFNFDDYFPSPSQQARELEEEIAEEHESSAPEPVQARKEPPQPPPPLPEPEPSLPSPRGDSPSPPPRRFFTSSGSHELMSLALHRSRRTAALEQIQQRERERVQAGIAVRQAEARARRDKAIAAAAANRQSKPAPRPVQFEQRLPQMKPPPVAKPVHKPTWKPEKGVDQQTPMCHPQEKPLKEANKENMEPPVDRAQAPSASQESEYGGDWVDEIALELMI
ncbi:hypothetical protein B0J13DRAFT_41967 [Dactylonectria estremocensis]|uniref:Uncharacterized protein n=1 Tax=Dactylonectria estremocensis TaxID=1079267 RepID=A0A9P9J763_9HYPO|nr:hypothetical protein B0J13DRAFT_41967 [Dactylonectria estremocensis]